MCLLAVVSQMSSRAASAQPHTLLPLLPNLILRSLKRFWGDLSPPTPTSGTATNVYISLLYPHILAQFISAN